MSASGLCYYNYTGSDQRSFTPGNWNTQGGTAGAGSAYNSQPMAQMGGPSLSYTGTAATNAPNCAANASNDPPLKWAGYSVSWGARYVIATKVYANAVGSVYAPSPPPDQYVASINTVYTYQYSPTFAIYTSGWSTGGQGGGYSQYIGGYSYTCTPPPYGGWVYPACFSDFNMTRLGYYWQRKPSGVVIPANEFDSNTGRKPGQGVGSAPYTTDSGRLGWEQTTYGSTKRYSDCANGGNSRYRYVSAAAQQARQLAEYGRYEFYKTGRYDVWKRYRFTQVDWRTGGVPGDIDRGIVQSGLETTSDVGGQEQSVEWRERWQMFCWFNPAAGVNEYNMAERNWVDQPRSAFFPTFTTRDCADTRPTPVWTCALDARADVQYPWRAGGTWFTGVRPSSTPVQVGADGRVLAYRWKRPDPKNTTTFQGIRNVNDRFFSVVPVTGSSPWLIPATTSPNAQGQPFAAMPKQAFGVPTTGWSGSFLTGLNDGSDTAHTYSTMRFFAPTTPGKEFTWNPEWSFTAEFQVGAVNIDYSDTNGNEGATVAGGNWQRLPAVCNTSSPSQWSGDTVGPAGVALTAKAQALSVRNIPDPWIQ